MGLVQYSPLIKVYLSLKFHKYKKTKFNNSKIRKWRVMVLVQILNIIHE